MLLSEILRSCVPSEEKNNFRIFPNFDFSSAMGADGPSEAQKRVFALRNEFQRQTQNPYRHMKAEGGTVVSFHIFLHCEVIV